MRGKFRSIVTMGLGTTTTAIMMIVGLNAAPASAGTVKAQVTHQAAATRQLYKLDYLLKWNGNAPPITAGSTRVVFAELHRCFNCSFPVGNAPSKYPSSGQFIPLSACYIPGIICLNAPVKAYPDDAHSTIRLVAQPGHFDGAGSVVTFVFSRDSAARLHLTVTGDVVNPSIPDWLDIEGAQAIWSRFARQLALNISVYQPGCANLHCP
jgi:hypothetical protein